MQIIFLHSGDRNSSQQQQLQPKKKVMTGVHIINERKKRFTQFTRRTD
jgi:hypothetical protein